MAKKCRAKTCVKALMYCTNAFYFWTQEPQSIQLWVLKYVNYSSFSKFEFFWHETDLFLWKSTEHNTVYTQLVSYFLHWNDKKKYARIFLFWKKILLLQQNITEHRFLLIKYLPGLKRGISRNRRLEELKMTNPFLHIMEKYIFSSILAT